MLRTASRARRLWTVRGADAVELLDAIARSGLRGLASSSNGGAVAASRADRTDTIARLVDFGAENNPGVFGEPALAPIPEGGWRRPRVNNHACAVRYEDIPLRYREALPLHASWGATLTGYHGVYRTESSVDPCYGFVRIKEGRKIIMPGLYRDVRTAAFAAALVRAAPLFGDFTPAERKVRKWIESHVSADLPPFVLAQSAVDVNAIAAIHPRSTNRWTPEEVTRLREAKRGLDPASFRTRRRFWAHIAKVSSLKRSPMSLRKKWIQLLDAAGSVPVPAAAIAAATLADAITVTPAVAAPALPDAAPADGFAADTASVTASAAAAALEDAPTATVPPNKSARMAGRQRRLLGCAMRCVGLTNHPSAARVWDFGCKSPWWVGCNGAPRPCTKGG